jgi:hypothetical protein
VLYAQVGYVFGITTQPHRGVPTVATGKTRAYRADNRNPTLEGSPKKQDSYVVAREALQGQMLPEVFLPVGCTHGYFWERPVRAVAKVTRNRHWIWETGCLGL